MNKAEILAAALAHREAEVFQHQINIDNYTLAIAEIDAKYAGDAAMQEFRARLADLLASSIVEQRKEIIMRDVIAKQLEG
jgi:cytochrome c551/c552